VLLLNVFDMHLVTETLGIYQLAEFVVVKSAFTNFFGTQPAPKTLGIYQLS
jgi:hypothetical protein